MYGKEIVDQLTEAKSVLNNFINNEKNIEAINRAAETIAFSIRKGRKVFSCGNGGSHCDAMHFAEEMTGNFRERRQALPAIVISDPSHMTCVGNDFGFESVFSRYVEGLGNEGDVLLAISCSGNSKNILNAAEAAQKKGMKVIGLTGGNGGALAKLADVNINVAHTGYADRVQEIHIKVIHILIFLIEKHLK